MQTGNKAGLSRQLGLLGLTSTGICSMLGASIYVVPFMIQRNVPGIDGAVLPAFLFAALPAIFAAFAYSILASAMPRAGGSYIYASRGLSPYLGFIASFSQWFGLSIAIGVISYVIIPFFRDIAIALNYLALGNFLNAGTPRVSLALLLLWLFVYINIRGVRIYERTLVPLMFMMFGLGAVVIIAGFLFNHQDFLNAISPSQFSATQLNRENSVSVFTLLAASAILFSSFIGFDSIAQAGGEAKNPASSLPKAIGLAVVIVGSFYFLFTAAVYHAVPWQFVAQEALQKDITAAGMLTYLLPASWGILIVAGAAIALLNDLPAMILSVSRLMFAWAADGIFPKGFSNIDSKYHTPKNAIIMSGVMASVGILGSHFAGDFFLGIDIMVTSMLVNFLLMCVTVVTLPRRNPSLAKEVKVLSNRTTQLILSTSGIVLLMGFLCVHIWKDLTSAVAEWYFHSTPVWIIVMVLATLLYRYKLGGLRKAGTDVNALFKELPKE
ncbi:MAG: amino acid permease [Cyclobacteriaceae bacterium]